MPDIQRLTIHVGEEVIRMSYETTDCMTAGDRGLQLLRHA